jgi:hypothetical protein
MNDKTDKKKPSDSQYLLVSWMPRSSFHRFLKCRRSEPGDFFFYLTRTKEMDAGGLVSSVATPIRGMGLTVKTQAVQSST